MTRAHLVAALGACLSSSALADGVAARAASACAVDTAGTTTSLRTGAPGLLVLALRTEPGVRVQARAPLRATLAATPGLALARDRLGWEDVADRATPALRVAFEARAPGPQRITARLEFFLCADGWCARQVRDVEIVVSVERGALGPSEPPPE